MYIWNITLLRMDQFQNERRTITSGSGKVLILTQVDVFIWLF